MRAWAICSVDDRTVTEVAALMRALLAEERHDSAQSVSPGPYFRAKDTESEAQRKQLTILAEGFGVGYVDTDGVR